MSLSFEYTWLVGARVSEKKIQEWQGSVSSYELNIDKYKNYFNNKLISLSKLYQLGIDKMISSKIIKKENVITINKDFINNIINKSDLLISNLHFCRSSNVAFSIKNRNKSLFMNKIDSQFDNKVLMKYINHSDAKIVHNKCNVKVLTYHNSIFF